MTKQGYFGAILASTLTGVSIGIAVYLLYKYSLWNSGSSAASRNKKSRKAERRSSDGETDLAHNNYGDSKAAKSPVNQSGDQTLEANTQSQTEYRASTGLVDSGEFTTIKMKVPKEMVGAIIGRQGCNIKQIQAETKTKIDFSKNELEGLERTITIRGSEKGTQDAELKILHIVYGQQSKQSVKIQVPQRALGFIIGSGGATVKKIQSDSECRVKVDSGSRDSLNADALADIDLCGTDEQIAAASLMIQTYLEEWETKYKKAKFSKEQNRPRRPATRRNMTSAAVFPGSALSCEAWPDTSDYVECYVTATVNPSHVWLQLLTPRSAKLEEVNARLSQLYSDHNQFSDDLVSNRPDVGVTVAARNPSDNMWYRGRISAYNDDNEPSVDIYYVDYGDSSWMPFENYNVQLLRPEFYSLPAQAIECYTDIIVNPGCPSDWAEAECDLFEKLSRTGSWNVLMGCLTSWKTQSGESGKFPVIKLIDTNTDVDIDIIEEVMKRVNAGGVVAENGRVSDNSSDPFCSNVNNCNADVAINGARRAVGDVKPIGDSEHIESSAEVREELGKRTSDSASNITKHPDSTVAYETKHPDSTVVNVTKHPDSTVANETKHPDSTVANSHNTSHLAESTNDDYTMNSGYPDDPSDEDWD